MKRNKIPRLSKAAFKVLLVIIVMIPFISNGYCLVSLESLLLGDFSEQYQEEITDPLYYIFRDLDRQKKNEKKTKDDKDFLKFVLYRGMIDEGHNLKNKCESYRSIDYGTSRDLVTAKRIFLSNLQFLILDLSTDYMANYANFFDFDTDEYHNLVDNLVGNYCSKNITTISLKELRKNMLARFSRGRGLDLPTIENSPFFPAVLNKVNAISDAREQEFAWTIELFKSSCSWANETDNERLLVPMLKNPIIASTVIRELSGLGLSWDEQRERVAKVRIKDSLKISCQNMICRKVDDSDFKQQVPRAIGSDSLESDFERLYCQYYKDVDYKTKNQEPKILKEIKETSFDDQNFLTSQLFSLLSGFPDFLIQSKQYSELLPFMRSPMDVSWDDWAKKQNANYSKLMMYEESLTIDLVEPSIYFNKFSPRFSIELDINQGEFDRSISVQGKLRLHFDVELSKKFLIWTRMQWRSMDKVREPKKVDRIRIAFRARIIDKIDQLKYKFPIVPWNESINELILDELLRQVVTYKGDFFSKDKQRIIKVPIYMNFSPFALRHMRYRYLIKKNKGGSMDEINRLRNLSL